jgi:hypothetical protein
MFLKENPPLLNDFNESSKINTNDSHSFLSYIINQQQNNRMLFDEQKYLKEKEEKERQEELNAAQLLLSLSSNSSLQTRGEEKTRKILKPHPKFRVKVNYN